MKAFPFDSQIVGQDENGMPIYDRASSASELARMLSSFFRDGVFGGGLTCMVSAGAGMTATVGKGDMLIQGRYGWIDIPETVTFEAAHDTLPRIDSVVFRLDLTSGVNNIVTAVVKGTPAAAPAAPSLTRDGTVWELGAADVLIPAGAVAINAANISDTRLDPSRCGVVAAVLTMVDTKGFFSEFDVMLDEMRRNLQGMYDGLEKANILNYTITLSKDEWQGDSPYTQRVATNGMVPSDAPFTDLDLTYVSEYNEIHELRGSWAFIYKCTAETDAIVFTASNIPVHDIPVKIKVVR